MGPTPTYLDPRECRLLVRSVQTGSGSFVASHLHRPPQPTIRYGKGERGGASGETVRKSDHPNGVGLLVKSLHCTLQETGLPMGPGRGTVWSVKLAEMDAQSCHVITVYPTDGAPCFNHRPWGNLRHRTSETSTILCHILGI